MLTAANLADTMMTLLQFFAIAGGLSGCVGALAAVISENF